MIKRCHNFHDSIAYKSIKLKIDSTITIETLLEITLTTDMLRKNTDCIQVRTLRTLMRVMMMSISEAGQLVSIRESMDLFSLRMKA